MANIIVYGRGKTGQSLMNMLQKMHKKAFLYDDVDGFAGDCKFDEDSLVLVSPGISPQAKGMVEAKNVKAKIVGELEFCFSYCKGRCISITGTNGKTTTCEMTAHILRCCDISTYLLGNGGVPLSRYVLDVQEDDVVVLESSSFQLADCRNFAPFVSVFTSLAPDHLNVHGTFDEYVRCKCNNFVHQRKGFSIFNLDDAAVTEVSNKCGAQRLFYSLSEPGADCYFNGNCVVLQNEKSKIEVKAEFLRCFAKHNISDALAAVLACCCVGVSPESAVQALERFVFPQHRLQKVGYVCGVSFVDDSKATNVHATVSALDCFSERLALILGGSDKGEKYDRIFHAVKANVVTVVAVGETAKAIKQCGAVYGVKVGIFGDFKDAVRYCFGVLKPTGGTVLMSNACASFDSFNGFEQRGEYFIAAVEEIRRENQKD